MRMLWYLLKFSVVQAVLNNETHTNFSPAIIDLDNIQTGTFTESEHDLITDALDYKKPESKEIIEAIIELEENYPDLAKRYFIFNGNNKTIFHASVAYSRPDLAMELMKSSVDHFSMREALPPGPLALRYLLTPEKGKNMGSKKWTDLIKFALENTDLNDPDGNQILKYAIEAGVYPNVIVTMANHTSGFGYHPNLTMPVLGLVLIAKISETWWFKSTIKTLREAGADPNEKFPYRNGPNITLLNMLCGQTIGAETNIELKNFFQKLLYSLVKFLLENDANPNLIDGAGMTACQTARSYSNTFLLELLNCEGVNWYDQAVNHAIKFISEKWSHFSNVVEEYYHSSFIARMTISLIFVYCGMKIIYHLFGDKNNNEFQKTILSRTFGYFLKWDMEIEKKILALQENKFIPQITGYKKNQKNPIKIQKKSPKPPKSPAPEIKIADEKTLESDFWNACAQGNLESCQKLLKEIKNYNTIKNGLTPLMITVKNRHLKIVELLLSLPGIDCDWISPENQTVLSIACQQKSESIVKLLCTHTPIPRLNKNSALQPAVFAQPSIAQSQQDELISATLDALFQNFEDDRLTLAFLSRFIEDGQIPLTLYWGEKGDYLISHLMHHGLFESFKFVLTRINQFSHLGLINSTNSHDRTPLMIACQSKQEKQSAFAQYLLDHAKNLRTHLEDKDGESALLKVVRNQKIDLANNLILKGCPLTGEIFNSSEFKKLKMDDQKRLIDSFKELNPPVEEKKHLPGGESKKLPPPKEIRKRTVKIKKDTPSKIKTEEKKSSPTLKPEEDTLVKKKPNREQKYQFDNKYHHEFATLSVNALKNLIAANALKPVTPQEISSQHCQLVIYIFELLKIVADYDRYLNDNRLDKRHRIIGNEFIIKTLQDWQLEMRHNTLPLLVSGQFIDEVKKTANDLQRLVKDDVIDKIIKERARKYHFTRADLEDLYAIMGHDKPVIEEEIKTIINIGKTVLYQVLTDFHLNFYQQMKAQVLLKQQIDYIWDHALEMIVEKYQYLCFTTTAGFSSHLVQKPKEITQWTAVKEFYSSDWHEIILLLMSCGDIYVQKQVHSAYDLKSIDSSLPKKEKIRKKRELLIADFNKRFEQVSSQEHKPNIKEFMRDCRHLVRNFLIHDAASLLLISDPDNLIFSKLCQYATHLWDSHHQFARKINWMENTYGQHLITKDLSAHGLFRTASNKEPGDIIFQYLGFAKTC